MRRSWRSAQRLGTDLDLLSVLGARLIVEESDAMAETTADVAHRRRITLANC